MFRSFSFLSFFSFYNCHPVPFIFCSSVFLFVLLLWSSKFIFYFYCLWTLLDSTFAGLFHFFFCVNLVAKGNKNTFLFLFQLFLSRDIKKSQKGKSPQSTHPCAREMGKAEAPFHSEFTAGMMMMALTHTHTHLLTLTHTHTHTHTHTDHSNTFYSDRPAAVCL
jgi:hypothetical protein